MALESDSGPLSASAVSMRNRHSSSGKLCHSAANAAVSQYRGQSKGVRSFRWARPALAQVGAVSCRLGTLGRADGGNESEAGNWPKAAAGGLLV
jgi:hypothetical protein